MLSETTKLFIEDASLVFIGNNYYIKAIDSSLN